MPVAPDVVAWLVPVIIGGKFVSKPELVGRLPAVVVGIASVPV
jgi:hypothetical protein